MTHNRVTLDVVEVKRPCPASWDAMSGDARSRVCTHCGRHVYNLSAMTPDDAQWLVCGRAGRLCVRFERDERGKLVTLDYQPRERSGRTWRFWTFVGGIGALAAGVVRFALWKPAPAPPRTVVMGDIAMPITNPAPAPAPAPPPVAVP